MEEDTLVSAVNLLKYADYFLRSSHSVAVQPSGNNLAGTLSESIGNLTNLNNLVSVSSDSCKQLQAALVVDSLSMFKQDISHNQFTGPLPAALFASTTILQITAVRFKSFDECLMAGSQFAILSCMACFPVMCLHESLAQTVAACCRLGVSSVAQCLFYPHSYSWWIFLTISLRDRYQPVSFTPYDYPLYIHESLHKVAALGIKG